MSDQQGGCCGGTGNAQRDNHRDADSRLDESAVITSPFPVATNECCCSTRVARDEVAGTDRSREVGGLGQVLPLVATREHGGIAAGCGCGPDVDALGAEEQGQAPLGVDAGNRTPLDFVGRDNVSDIDAGLANDESGSPECCVDNRNQESRNANSSNPIDQSACCGGGCCGTTENQNEHGGDYFAGARRERDHELHVVTEVTR